MEEKPPCDYHDVDKADKFKAGKKRDVFVWITLQALLRNIPPRIKMYTACPNQYSKLLSFSVIVSTLYIQALSRSQTDKDLIHVSVHTVSSFVKMFLFGQSALHLSPFIVGRYQFIWLLGYGSLSFDHKVIVNL